MNARLTRLFDVLAGPVRPILPRAPSQISTRWVAITGAPGTGKTTVCKGLRETGYLVIPEASRDAIHEAMQQGFSTSEIFKHPRLLSEAILIRKLAIAQSLSPAEPWIWDTALGDALVFCRLANVDVSKYRPTLLSYRFRATIVLDPLNKGDLPKDAIRPQDDAERSTIHTGLLTEYETQGYTINRLPCGGIPDRMQAIRALVGYAGSS